MMTDELIAQEKRAFGVNLLEALVFFDAYPLPHIDNKGNTNCQ
jgi:hypothetical protein